MNATLTELQIDLITLDPNIQPRAMIDDGVTGDYGELMQGGAEFPPVVVYAEGGDYWLADGFHRVYGALAAGLTSITAEVRQGGRRDAILYAAGCNAGHGLR